MRFTRLAACLLFLATCSCQERGNQIAIQPFDALATREDIRSTLKRIYPNNQIPIFQDSGDLLLAVVEDFDSDRFLLVRAHGWNGDISFKRDGKLLTTDFDEQLIEHYGSIVDSTGSREDQSRTYSDHLGYWIPLKRNENLKLSAKLDYPEHAQVELAYSAKQGWVGSIERLTTQGN